PRKDLEADRAPHARRLMPLQCLCDCRSNAGKALPRLGCGKCYLYRRRGRFSPFGMRKQARFINLGANGFKSIEPSASVYPRGMCSLNLCQTYRTTIAPRMETISPPG